MMINFEQVKLQGRKSGKCVCGKKRIRSKTFSQTLNPYNKNKNGRIKSRGEIQEELITKRDGWSKEQIFCEKCRPLTYWEATRKQRKLVKITIPAHKTEA